MNMRILILFLAFFLLFPLLSPATADTSTQDSFNNAGALYSKSVDLANEGKYQEALNAADEALALNMSSLKPLIQANRAGILVMLSRYDEAISAADAAISTTGNLTTTYSIAYYNKGDALRHLGRIDEARVAFAKAQELDPSLSPPDMSMPFTTPLPVTKKSPLSTIASFAGIGCAAAVYIGLRLKKSN
ncbi:MAG: tetratricopeptide repeat protein [Methanoregula sp.]|nr:tetratricopeptide repeat protein [Methanoregula sp.]